MNKLIPILFVFLVSCSILNEDEEVPTIEWKRIDHFKGKDVQFLAVDDNTIFALSHFWDSQVVTISSSTDLNNWTNEDVMVRDEQAQQTYLRVSPITAFAANEDRIYLGSENTEIFVQSPNNTIFNKVLDVHDDDIVKFSFQGNRVFASALCSGLYYSGDGGQQWEKILGNQTNFNDYLEVTSATPAVNDQLFVSTRTLLGDAADQSYLLRTSAPYHSWNMLYSGNLAKDHFSFIHQANNDELIAGTYYRGVLYSFDNGASWTSPDSSYFLLTDKLVTNSSGHLFVSARNFRGPMSKIITSKAYMYSVYRSTDIGNQWENIASDTLGIINDIAMSSKGYLLVATNNGVFKTSKSTKSSSSFDWGF